MKRITSLIMLYIVVASIIVNVSAKTEISSLNNTNDVNSEINDYGLACDNYPMLCKPQITGDFIQSWYCENWTASDWQGYYDKFKEAGISTVIIQTVCELKDGKFSNVEFEPDSEVEKNMQSECDGNRKMLSLLLESAKQNNIKVMIGMSMDSDWWSTEKNQNVEWYTIQAEMASKAAESIYNGYYNEYSDIICGWYWPYEMWTCGENDVHLELAWSRMMNVFIDKVKMLTPELPIMFCPYISKYYGTENAYNCWKTFFEESHLRDGDIIAPQDGYVSTGFELSKVEQHMADIKSASLCCDGKIEFWADVENFETQTVDDYIKQLRICSKYATNLIAFSYAHYYAENAELRTQYVSYVNRLNEMLLGDINLDKKVDIIDLVFARSYIVGNLGLENLTVADMNKDSSVDIIDVVMIRRIIVDEK